MENKIKRTDHIVRSLKKGIVIEIDLNHNKKYRKFDPLLLKNDVFTKGACFMNKGAAILQMLSNKPLHSTKIFAQNKKANVMSKTMEICFI